MKPTLLILSAGMGSRYGSLKQMDAFGPSGETIIDYSIYDAINAGFGKIVFVVREYFKEEFKAMFDKRFSDKIQLEYVTQELEKLPEGLVFPAGREKPWGTAHAVWVANHVINEPFAVINADDFYGADAFQVLADFLKNDKTRNYCVVGYFLKNTLSDYGTVNRGVCTIDECNNLMHIEECVKIGKNDDGTISYPTEQGPRYLTPDTLVSMNMWGLKPSYFEYTQNQLVDFINDKGEEPKSEFYIPTVIDKLINDNSLDVNMLSTTSNWFGVTYPEDKQMVQESLQTLLDEGVYPRNLYL